MLQVTSNSNHSPGNDDEGFLRDSIEEVASELVGTEAVVLKGLSKTFYPGRGRDPIIAVSSMYYFACILGEVFL